MSGLSVSGLQRRVVALAWGGLLAATACAQELAVKGGDAIAFLGDSITQQGNSSPSGYVKLVISGLAANGVDAKGIGAGISGHKSNQMLARLQKDVIDKKPTVMTLSCGVNDVWHGARGVPLDQYKENITQIVDRCQAAGIKVMILTATMIYEDAGHDNNKKLAPYNDFLRQLAADKGCLLADLNADMQAAVKARRESGQKGNVLTRDGVHMNPIGDQTMASGILKALGMSDAQLAKAREHWLDIPGAWAVGVKARITLRQYAQLEALAAERNQSVDALVSAELAKALDTLLAPKAPTGN